MASTLARQKGVYALHNVAKGPYTHNNFDVKEFDEIMPNVTIPMSMPEISTVIRDLT